MTPARVTRDVSDLLTDLGFLLTAEALRRRPKGDTMATTDFSHLTRTMQGIDEDAKEDLLFWFRAALERAGLEDPTTQRVLLSDMIGLCEIPLAPGERINESQRFEVAGGWLARDEAGQYWGKLQVDDAAAQELLFVFDQHGAVTSWGPKAPAFVATDWE